MPTLNAWIGDRRVGGFSEEHLPDGSLFSFQYAEHATERDLVSLTMIPGLQALRFEMRSFPPPFDMILPEGERRVRIEAARKILRADDFSLLSYVGANPVNRVRFLAPHASPDDDVPPLPTPKEIADCAQGKVLFKRLMKDLDLRQGIAGVQPKILGLPESISKLSTDLRSYRGSTHILKSSTSEYPLLAVNERVCLEVFKIAGLQVPNVTLSADGELLLVERFDVLPDGSCLGFEEAAALMGETSATKYHRDYGSLIESLSAFVPPSKQGQLRVELTQALLLNYLLGNGDAHLKNFGLVYSDQDHVKLAPFYDCVSTLPYIPQDVPALVLSFDWYSKAWWPRIKLEEFAQEHGGLSRIGTLELIEESLAAVASGIACVRSYRREIPAFDELGGQMEQLWNERINAFKA